MKKKLFYLLFLFLVLLSYNSYGQNIGDFDGEGGESCSLSLTYNGQNIDHTQIPKITLNNTQQTITVYLQFSSPDCSQTPDYDENADWLTVQGSGWTSFTISVDANTTPNTRSTSIGLLKSNSLNPLFFLTIEQQENSQYSYYYQDSDGDGFGDYNASPITSIAEPPGMADNNLDYCPFDAFTTNNGCEEPYEDINWIRSASYDINGNMLSASKSYFDALGKGTQTQTFDIKENRTWATQTMYDEQGRPAFQSLSAPITGKGVPLNFQYKDDFIKYSDNSRNYSVTDFTIGDLYAPKTVGNAINTLGRYYSTSNTDEPNQDITDRPYSRTIYSTLNPGAVKQTVGGNKVKDTNNDGNINDNDDWIQGYTFSMPAAQEMYYVYGHDYFETSPDIQATYSNIQSIVSNSNNQINWLKTTKTVTEDVDGNQAVVFTDTDGKTLGAARVGVPEETGKVEKQYPVLSLIGEQKYVDIHIPVGCESSVSFVGANSSDFKIFDLKTEEEIQTITSPGFYRVEYTGNKVFSKLSTLTYIEKNSTTIQPVESDAVGIRYNVNYYDFSLNYYNKTGQLTSSIQPIGFNDDCLDKFESKDNVNHNSYAISEFQYNALGQLTYTKSPDEGEARFVYRKDGQIRFSQNSKQDNNEEISYTDYDELGRPVESGVITDTGSFGGIDGLKPFVDTSLTDISIIGNDFKEQHFTEYDFLADNSELPSNYQNPTFLAGNVVTTYNYHNNSTNKISQTWYSYDLYGRVKWIVQKLYDFSNTTNGKIITIDYVYDPVTSQVNSVIFQKDNTNEYFEHKYTYNIAQELEKVETRTSNIGTFVTHAEYEYYETGALKRTVLADGIQGIDYIYNLSGQLKAINHPNLDTETGRPDAAGNDLFGMTLDYYNGDYRRDSNGFSFSAPNIPDQFNGNIKALTWNTDVPNQANIPSQYGYRYNKNNWLTDATFYDDVNNFPTTIDSHLTFNQPISTTTEAKALNSITLEDGFAFTATSSSTFTAKIEGTTHSDYDVSGITYDANGNIKTLNRNKNTETINGVTSNVMDQLSYHYYDDATNVDDKNPNRLKRVVDGVTQDTNADDIKTQTTVKNYEYNSIGQLTKNNDEDVEYEYNASGLVTKVKYNGFTRVEFFYNDKGYRTQKKSYKSNSNDLDKTTDYVLDASGSTLAIYENGQLVELPIYGASRLGIFKRPSESSVYQLTDHLGNVRAAIISDNAGGAIAQVATDYYPFGMAMPGRIFGKNGYRYQYQGQEVDPETGKEAFQLRLWDGRIGRWLTTDPANQFSSPYMGMGNNPMNGVDPDGAEWYWNSESNKLEWHAGRGVIEGLMWIAKDGTSMADLKRLDQWLGGSGDISGNDFVFSKAASIGNGWDDGLQQRGEDFTTWWADPKGRTLQGVVNFVNDADSFINDYVDNGNGMDIWGFAGKRALEGISEMSLYDWGYAAGYNGPDIAFSFAGGYAFAALRGALTGEAIFQSTAFGYRSKLFGRYHPYFLPDGRKGWLNRGYFRTGWGNNNGRDVFRTGIGKGKHIDWFYVN